MKNWKTKCFHLKEKRRKIKIEKEYSIQSKKTLKKGD
jgi:hypothetical protein